MKKKSLLLFAAFCGMISCSDNSENKMTDGKNLKVKPLLGYQSRTKSVTKTTWTDGDKIGLFVTNGSIGSPYNGLDVNNNVLLSYKAGWWELINVPLNLDQATVYGYYPFNSEISSGASIPVEIASQTDYLWGVGDRKASAIQTDINLNMEHALTQVEFRMNKIRYTKGPGKLTKVSFSNIGSSCIRTDGTLDCANGQITAGTVQDIDLSVDHTILETESSLTAILIPVAATSGEQMKVSFVIDGNEYYYIFPSGTAWEQGNRNIYSFTLRDNYLVIGGDAGNGVTIEPWVDDNEGSIPLIPVI